MWIKKQIIPVILWMGHHVSVICVYFNSEIISLQKRHLSLMCAFYLKTNLILLTLPINSRIVSSGSFYTFSPYYYYPQKENKRKTKTG